MLTAMKIVSMKLVHRLKTAALMKRYPEIIPKTIVIHCITHMYIMHVHIHKHMHYACISINGKILTQNFGDGLWYYDEQGVQRTHQLIFNI